MIGCNGDSDFDVCSMPEWEIPVDVYERSQLVVSHASTSPGTAQLFIYLLSIRTHSTRKTKKLHSC